MVADLQGLATAPRGAGSLLADELAALGCSEVREVPAGVAFRADLAALYRACLCSRLAERVLLPMGEVSAGSAEALYAGARELAWEAWLVPERSVAVGVYGAPRRQTHYLAQRVKDALADRLRQVAGRRPSVDIHRPDLRVHVHLRRGRASLAVDLAGPLARRGYLGPGERPELRPNLAAAVLQRAGWPGVAQAGGTLVLPLGGGVLAVEAAAMAAGLAPGLLLQDAPEPLGWRGHDPALWRRVREEAARRAVRPAPVAPIVLCEPDEERARSAGRWLERAGLTAWVRRCPRGLAACTPDRAGEASLPGLLVAALPYAAHASEEGRVAPLYAALGSLLRSRYLGWQAAVYTGNPGLGHRLGLRARRQNVLANGPVDWHLLRLTVEPGVFHAPPDGPGGSETRRATPPAPMLANRLRKNLRHLGRWARRNGIHCYRLYDADIPEYPVAVDLYQGERTWVHVQEYQAPRGVPGERAALHWRQVMATVPDLLGVAEEDLFFKLRRHRRGDEQYGRLGESGRFHRVAEGGLAFLVNFSDYLDTGLFLDHRLIRALVREQARGRDFLNLFAYTGTASVYAAAGGAASTTSVDLSANYLDWARRNLTLNGFGGPSHRRLRADCLAWLAEQARAREARYGLILLDPPTLSRSRRMDGRFDVQRDHVRLIRQAAALLADDGLLLFSTNYGGFELDAAALAGLAVQEITAATLPKDFPRRPPIHRCWRVRAG